MTDEDFRKTRIKGEKAELRVIEWLKEEHPGLKKIEGYCKGYDLEDSFGYRVEVKLDLASERTGNIGLEYQYKGSLSGIGVTIANDWVHIFYYKNKWIYMIANVLDLKNFIRSNWGCFKVVNGGDDNLAKIILIKKEWVVENFTTYII